MKKFVLGIGGYIGSGKTTAGRIFEKFGVRFIDADAVVDDLYRKGEDGYRKIMSFFGEEYLKRDGELNRKKLAQTVFADPKKLRILQDLIHPLVTNRIRKMIDREVGMCETSEKECGAIRVFVIEATYFQRKHLLALVDAILWIECKKEILFERLRNERGMEHDFFEKIFRVQVPPPRKDFVVENNGSMKNFDLALGKVWKKIQKEVKNMCKI